MNIQQPSLISNDLGATVLKSVCRSCHGGCGVLLHVKDGVLLKVEGDRDSPLNHGRLCPIGTVTADLVYHKDRLKYPLRRKGKRQSGDEKRRCDQNPAEDARDDHVPPWAVIKPARAPRSPAYLRA